VLQPSPLHQHLFKPRDRLSEGCHTIVSPKQSALEYEIGNSTIATKDHKVSHRSLLGKDPSMQENIMQYARCSLRYVQKLYADGVEVSLGTLRNGTCNSDLTETNSGTVELTNAKVNLVL